MSQDDIREGWDRRAARLALRVNLGWWLQFWLPVVMAVSFAAALALLVLRSLGSADVRLLWIGFAVAAGLGMAVAWWLARRHFEDLPAARIRLEDALGLRSRLTAASNGVGAWPALPLEGVKAPLSWRWQRPAGTLAICASILTLAAVLPVPQRGVSKHRIIEKPSAVKQVEQWVEELRKDETVTPQNLAEVEQKVEELLRRPNDQWYEHTSLEAADHLRDETGRALQELGSQLEQTQASMAALAELSGQLSNEAKQALAKQAQKNLNGLRSGAMQAGASLTDQLKNIDPSALQNMSKEQMQKLSERMKQNADALRKALANAPQYSFKECQGSKKGSGKGKEGDKPGDGDPTRGKADADLTLNKDETNLHTQKTDRLETMLDPERVTPGDLLELQDAKPSVDPNAYSGIKAGGGLQSTGDGGAAIEKATLIPAERAVLKRFFK